ncbi:hypothetical protein QA640_36075 [Bradyrhizobium sp. CB82]|uniref:hypothetical protein n=1 Tax=Bradyrhizobium sp. CB82 TaxID=3039159 RepID=UPI0024B22D6F|nr:hypothetical protein [Bradyrhizobium sp. CB82]WFU39719.1 hypothetical protein QA640_36075 [Bradyrhizobium sp. CB82]
MEVGGALSASPADSTKKRAVPPMSMLPRHSPELARSFDLDNLIQWHANCWNMRKKATISMVEGISMSNPNWFSWYSFPFFAPLSGPVIQDIETNVGARLDEDVAKRMSVTERFDTLSDAVEELDEKLRTLAKSLGQTLSLESFGDNSDQPTPMQRLRNMIDAVNKIKDRHRQDADQEAKRALNLLKTVDPARYSEFVREFEGGGGPRREAGRASG